MLHHRSYSSLCTVPRKPSPSLHNPPLHIWEISHTLVLMTIPSQPSFAYLGDIPHHSGDDMQHHIHFISSSIGTMITTIFSSFHGDEITSPILKIAPSMTIWTKPFYGLSKFCGPMKKGTISYPFLPASASLFQPTPHDLSMYLPPFSSLFHSNEDILEDMTTPKFPWDALPHHYFLPPEK